MDGFARRVVPIDALDDDNLSIARYIPPEESSPQSAPIDLGDQLANLKAREQARDTAAEEMDRLVGQILLRQS